MPTPFMHLRVAEQLAESAREDETLPAWLWEHWPAYSFGHIAPDYQALCGVRRSATHFHQMPPVSRDEAVASLLNDYPALAAAPLLARDQAAFVAGYLAHLFLDLVWHFDVVMPVFVESPQVDNSLQGNMIHFGLLAVLDSQARAQLAPSAAQILRAANPVDWALFAPDADLRMWRDYVAAQLDPGAESRTIEIYAGRLRMTPESFAAQVHDEGWLATELNGRVPVTSVRKRLQTAVAQTVQLTSLYLQGELRPNREWMVS